MLCVGCPAEDGQPGLEGVLHEAEHQVHPARPRGFGRRSSSDPGTPYVNRQTARFMNWFSGRVPDYCRTGQKIKLITVLFPRPAIHVQGADDKVGQFLSQDI
jgi:hypothetical protein